MQNKFLSSDDLTKSYNELERAFTKKCQENASLKKELESLKSVATIEANEIAISKSLDDIVEENAQSLDKIVEETEEKRGEEKIEETSPQEQALNLFDSAKVRIDAQKFLVENQEAKSYSKDISKLLIKNPELLKLDNPYMVAFGLVLANEKKEKKNLEPILLDETDSQEKEQLPQTSVGAILPRVLGKESKILTTPKKKYSSFEDARYDLILRYFS